MSRNALLSLCLLFLMVTVAGAEPVPVHNSDQPAKGLVKGELKEIWRTGGDDDEVFFGTIGAVKSDAEGNIYLLDSQLSEVHRFSPDGELLGTIGQEGDGPGEMRAPNDLFILDDGTVCVLQGFPGRVVRLHPDGTPAGDATYSQGEGGQGQFAVMVRGLSHPNGMVLAGIRMSFGGGSVSKQNYFLAQCDPEGKEQRSLLNKEHTIDYSAFELDEMSMDFVWSRLALGPEGRIVTAPARDVMRFEVYAPDGSLERVFDRDYDSGTRTDHENKLARQIIEAVGANYPVPPTKITIEDRQAAVNGLWVTNDGRIWVQPGNRQADLPAGTWTMLDVYNAAGEFEHQVALTGDHNEDTDQIFIQPNGRFVVVTGALDAWLNQQAVSSDAGDDDEGDDEDAALEVVCYELDF